MIFFQSAEIDLIPNQPIWGKCSSSKFWKKYFCAVVKNWDFLVALGGGGSLAKNSSLKLHLQSISLEFPILKGNRVRCFLRLKTSLKLFGSQKIRGSKNPPNLSGQFIINPYSNLRPFWGGFPY